MDTPVDTFQRMCRTCMMQDQNFRSIYDSVENQLKICEMLATVTPQLLILSSDKLPKQLCVACLNKLNIAYGFQQMCIASEKQLLNSLCADQVLCATELPLTVTTAMEQDPLLAEELTKYQECIKNEENVEEVKDFDFEKLVQSAQEVNGTKNEAESQSGDYSTHNTDNECSEVEEKDIELQSTRTRSQTAKGSLNPKESLTSSMHNETGVDEIEKPIPRNRRKTKLPCPHCDKIFDRPYNLKRHSGVHSQARQFECETCNYRFSTVNQLTRHKLSHVKSFRPAPPDGYKCAECPRRFEKRESLSAHIQSHRKSDPDQTFKCDLCPKKFRKFTVLTKHARTHPENQKYKCTLCVKTFGLQAHLIEHMNKHNGLKPFVCVYCSKAFLQNSTLKEHQRIHTGEKPFLCAQCGKSFQNASNMRQHLLRHSDERRYQCPECPSKFACQSDQIKHMSTHRAIKPHICDICGSSFTRSYTLTKHKQIHTGERPHKCEECNMTFVFIDHMRRHKRTHTGEKPYKCKFCDRAYAESGDLNKHLRTHVGEKTYMCNQCPEAFKYQLELREHQRLHYKQQQAAAVELDVVKTEI